jgi:hypothetical protein
VSPKKGRAWSDNDVRPGPHYAYAPTLRRYVYLASSNDPSICTAS